MNYNMSALGGGVWTPPTLTNAPTPGQTPPASWTLPQSPSMGGGVTRQGSQMIDANGQVIGHYGDQNQPVYNQGQGPGQLPGMPQGPKFPGQPPGPRQWDEGTGMGFGQMPQGQPITPFDPTGYARFSSAYAPPANPLSGYSLGRLGGR